MREDRLQDLAEAVREEKELQKCYRHGSAVYFDDSRGCPACALLHDFDKIPVLTKKRNDAKT
jgi:hypothetical protein